MKKILFISLLFLMSCSTATDDTLNDEVEEIPEENFKLLTSMFDANGSVELLYDNNILASFDDEGEKYELEYNTSNKVSITTNQFNENMTFTYLNDKLIQIDYGFYQDSFDYDSNGNIISVIENANDGYDESNYITYHANGIVQSYKIGLNGSIYTFEFDNKINPYYIIWEQFGFVVDLEDRIYDIIPMFFPNNPTKIYKNSELRLEANYTYDTEGYPLRCEYTRYWNNSQSTQGNMTYLYL